MGCGRFRGARFRGGLSGAVEGERYGVGDGCAKSVGGCAAGDDVGVGGYGVKVGGGCLAPFGSPVGFGGIVTAVFEVGKDPGGAGLGGVGVLVLSDEDAVADEAYGFLVEVLRVKVPA